MTDIFQSPSDQGGTQTESEGTQNPEHPLVGDGKKYATMEAALESLVPKEEHISNLEAELATLREGQTKMETLEASLEALQAKQGIDPSKLAELVDSRIASNNQADVQKANVEAVVTTLTQKFGDAEKASEAYNKRAAELGMTPEALTELATQSPTAVLEYFGAEQGTPAPTKTTGSVNTETLNVTATSGDHDYAWWQNLRRSDEKAYYRRANEMHSDVARLGRERFYQT
jgi:hypothetical protein